MLQHTEAMNSEFYGLFRHPLSVSFSNIQETGGYSQTPSCYTIQCENPGPQTPDAAAATPHCHQWSAKLISAIHAEKNGSKLLPAILACASPSLHFPPAPQTRAKSRTVLSREEALEIFLFKLARAATNPPAPSAAAVARAFSVGEKTVRDIWTGRTWAHETATLDPSLLPRGRRIYAPRKPAPPRPQALSPVPRVARPAVADADADAAEPCGHLAAPPPAASTAAAVGPVAPDAAGAAAAAAIAAAAANGPAAPDAADAAAAAVAVISTATAAGLAAPAPAAVAATAAWPATPSPPACWGAWGSGMDSDSGSASGTMAPSESPADCADPDLPLFDYGEPAGWPAGWPPAGDSDDGPRGWPAAGGGDGGPGGADPLRDDSDWLNWPAPATPRLDWLPPATPPAVDPITPRPGDPAPPPQSPLVMPCWV